MEIQELYETSKNGIVLVDTGDGFGTGFCTRPDGLIITNAHVVGLASDVVLQMAEGLQFEGTVIAVDRMRDLAAVHCEGYEARVLPPLVLYRDVRVRVGDPVIAIGHPDNSANFSLTQGVISSLPRPREAYGFLQLNLSVNWGNSGGPILSHEGFVVGVTVQLVLTRDGNHRIEGLSRAIPHLDVITFMEGIPLITPEMLETNHYCFSCGRFVANNKYCPNCGFCFADQPERKKTERLEKNISGAAFACPVCGLTTPANTSYCPRCGSKL